MKRIYILGSLNTDLVISSKIPEKGETVRGRDFFMNCGGKGANQAAAAALLGGDVYMAGCVGKDSFGKNMKENMKHFGVDVSGIRETDEVSSGVALIVLSDGDNRIILDGGANLKLEKSDVDKLLKPAEAGDVFLTQLENNIEITGYALKAAKEKGLFTVLNPAPYSEKILPYFEYCDMITPNETELALMCGNAGNVSELTRKLPIKETLVTLGGKGYYYRCGEKEIYGACPKVNVIDTTAAGDTFCGALCLAIAEGKPREESFDFASHAATLAVTKKGAMQSIPSRTEVENSLLKSKKN